MRIVPKRGLSINNVHAPQGVPVDVEDKLALELIALDAARYAPAEVVAPVPVVAPEPVIETAEAAPAPETAVVRRRRK
jgi:hypothetical protein